jgi:shikimate kinase/3-dehydroquinate synthase
VNRDEPTFLPAPTLSAGRPLLVVTGFMGTGKTTAGTDAASALRLPFVDLDRSLEGRVGSSVETIFDRSGEDGFRRLERDLLVQAAKLSGSVVATGGGAVLHGPWFGRLAEAGIVVVLSAEPAEIERRIGGGRDRPLLRPDPPARIRALLDERAESYRAAGPQLDTTSMSLADVGEHLALAYTREARPRPHEPLRLEINAPQGPYPVLVGEGVSQLWAAELGQLAPSCGRVVVVADGSLGASILDEVTGPLERAGLPAARISLPPGESAKSIEVVADLWSRFRAEGLDRNSVVVAVGGGSTLDAAGFAAATYARGIGVVNIPTTLLAMYDAAIGGKVAIDHAGVKNLVGAFHHPRMVIADLAILKSLPVMVMRAGLGEAVKALVLASPLGLDVLEAEPSDERGLPLHLPWLIEEAIRIKASYVSADPEERSIRTSLNLGHTFAHAIESASGYQVAHGDAVAVGLVAAARLGAAVGITPPRLAARLARLLSRLGLPTRPPSGLDHQALVEAMHADKKRRGGRWVFVVPAEEGAALVTEMPDVALSMLMADEQVPGTPPLLPSRTKVGS